MTLRATSFWLLVALTLVSAIGVVFVKHQNRKYFAELQRLQAVRDQMNMEWGQLQLEQSTWAAHGRVEGLAYSRLNMRIPPTEEVMIVRP